MEIEPMTKGHEELTSTSNRYEHLEEIEVTESGLETPRTSKQKKQTHNLIS